MHLEEPPKLVQPRNHKAKVSIWADLTVSDMDLIDDAYTPDALKEELARIFNIDDYRDNLKNGILLDLYYYTIQFCRDHQFSKEQSSAFFSIIKRTHEVCVETPFGNVEQTFDYFKELVLCHAVKRPPFSIDLFSPLDVKNITEYVINTYFRHFKMYKYVFTPLVRLDLSMQYNGMPPTPEPSEAGDQEGLGDQEEGEGGEDGDGDKEGGDLTTPAEEVTEPEKKEEDAKDDMSMIKEEPENTPPPPPTPTHPPVAPQQAKSDPSPQPASKSPSRNGKARKQRVRFEESAASKEFRKLIKQHLSEELQKLKQEVDQQIKESEEVINQKLSAVAPKSGRGSGKGKKK